MQLWHSALQFCLLFSAIPAQAAAAWGFTDATVSVQTKGAGVGSGSKQQYVAIMGNTKMCYIMLILFMLIGSPTTNPSPVQSLSEAWIPSA